MPNVVLVSYFCRPWAMPEQCIKNLGNVRNASGKTMSITLRIWAMSGMQSVPIKEGPKYQVLSLLPSKLYQVIKVRELANRSSNHFYIQQLSIVTFFMQVIVGGRC